MLQQLNQAVRRMALPTPPLGNGWLTLPEWIMIALTAAILVLTVAVVVYASRTLRATQQSLGATKESLDFFAKPVVALRCPGPLEKSCPAPDSEGTILGTEVVFTNDSALPVCVHSSDDIVLEIDKDGSSSRHLSIKQTNLFCDEHHIAVWPAPVRQILHVYFRVLHSRTVALAEKTKIVVRICVRYTYRGRPFEEETKSTYVVRKEAS